MRTYRPCWSLEQARQLPARRAGLLSQGHNGTLTFRLEEQRIRRPRDEPRAPDRWPINHAYCWKIRMDGSLSLCNVQMTDNGLAEPTTQLKPPLAVVTVKVPYVAESQA
jgi:hypothetical protein